MSADQARASGGTASGGDGGEPIKIGDFARLAGTNLRTLRYYEEVGLLPPAVRSAGGFRYYRLGDLDRLRMIASLQQLGLELARIRELMDTRDQGSSRAEFFVRVRHALQQQSVLIDARVLELETRKQDLGKALSKLSECEHCEHRPEHDNNFCHPCQIDGKPLPVDLSALF